MKKVFLAVACVLVGWAVHADAMYWQLAGQNITGVADNQWTMAQIEVFQKNGSDWVGTGTYLKYLDDPTVDLMDKSVSGAWFDVSGYSGTSPEYSFVLELVNDALEIQGATTPVSYNDLDTAGKIVKNSLYDSTFNSLTPVNYSTYNAGAGTTADLPEPTSGLLMLLGASLLALRRRQA